MREHSGTICEMVLEVLLCLFFKYPCCDLFCGHVGEFLVGHCGHCKNSGMYWGTIGMFWIMREKDWK